MTREEQHHAHEEMEDLVDLRSIWVGLRRQIGLFLAVTATVMLGVSAYILWADELFTAETSLVIEPKSEVYIDGSAAGGQARPDPLLVDTEVELLRSRAMANRVIQRLRDEEAGSGVATASDANNSMDFLDQTLSQESASIDTPTVSDDETSVADAGAGLLLEPTSAETAPASSADITLNPLDAATLDIDDIAGAGPTGDAMLTVDTVRSAEIEKLLSRLDVERVGSTFLIKLRVLDESPEEAARIANAYAEEYILEKMQADLAALRRANTWIDTRLQVLRNEVRSAEEEAAIIRAQEGIAISGGRESSSFTEQQIAALAGELRTAKSNYSVLKARHEAVTDVTRTTRDAKKINETLSSPLINELNRQLSEAERNVAELQVRYGSLHPQLKVAREETRQIRTQIDTEVTRIVQSVGAELQLAEAQVRTLEEELATAKSSMAVWSKTSVRLQELDRNLQAPRAVYEALLNRKKELNERDQLLKADARIVARAAVPDSPSHPRKKLLFAGGLVLAMMLGGGAAFTAEMLDGRVRNTKDLRREFGDDAPVVLVPRLQFRSLFGQNQIDEVARTHVLNEPGMYAEAMRDLRMHLKAAQRDFEGRSMAIAFSSVFRREGKSTTAFSFAALLASSGHRVAFIDCSNGERGFSENEVKDESAEADYSAEVQSIEQLQEGAANQSVALASHAEEAAAAAGGGASVAARSESNIVDASFSTNGQLQTLVDIASRQSNLEITTKFERCNVDIAELRTFGAGQSEYVDIAAFSRFIASLREVYDYVIIDAPDLMSKSEASLIAGCADVVAFTVAWCETTRAAVRVGVQRLMDARAKILSFVVTKADDSQRYYYGPDDRHFFYRRKFRVR